MATFSGVEDFDSYSNGDDVNGKSGGSGWSGNWSATAAKWSVSNAQSVNSPNSALLDGTNSDVLQRQFSTISSGSFIVHAAVRTSSVSGAPGNDNAITIYILNSAQSAYCNMYIDAQNNVVKCFASGGSPVTVSGDGSLAANTWLHFWLEVDIDNHRCRGYYSSTIPHSAQTFSSYSTGSIANAAYFVADANKNGRTYTSYLDDIRDAGSDFTSVTNITVNATVLAGTFSLPASTVTAVENVSATSSVLSATFSLPSAVATGGATVSPSVLSATFSLPAPDIQIPNVTISPSVLSLTVSLPTPGVVTDWVQAVNTLLATFSLPTPTVSTVQNQTISPQPLSLIFSLPVPTRIGGLWTNQSRASAATVANQTRVTSSWDNQDRSLS